MSQRPTTALARAPHARLIIDVVDQEAIGFAVPIAPIQERTRVDEEPRRCSDKDATCYWRLDKATGSDVGCEHAMRRHLPWSKSWLCLRPASERNRRIVSKMPRPLASSVRSSKG